MLEVDYLVDGKGRLCEVSEGTRIVIASWTLRNRRKKNNEERSCWLLMLRFTAAVSGNKHNTATDISPFCSAPNARLMPDQYPSRPSVCKGCLSMGRPGEHVRLPCQNVTIRLITCVPTFSCITHSSLRYSLGYLPHTCWVSQLVVQYPS